MLSSSSQRIGDIPTVVAEAYCPSCEYSYPEALDRCPDDGTLLVRLAEKRNSLVGKIFDGRFRLIEKLGHGGMGTVYRAQPLGRAKDG